MMIPHGCPYEGKKSQVHVRKPRSKIVWSTHKREVLGSLIDRHRFKIYSQLVTSRNINESNIRSIICSVIARDIRSSEAYNWTIVCICSIITKWWWAKIWIIKYLIGLLVESFVGFVWNRPAMLHKSSLCDRYISGSHGRAHPKQAPKRMRLSLLARTCLQGSRCWVLSPRLKWMESIHHLVASENRA